VLFRSPPLAALIERAVSSGVPPNANQLSMAVSEIIAELPAALGEAFKLALAGIEKLPIAAASDVHAIPLGRRRENLPDWLLPSRTIGAFYVVRALGSGGAASVSSRAGSRSARTPKRKASRSSVPTTIRPRRAASPNKNSCSSSARKRARCCRCRTTRTSRASSRSISPRAPSRFS